MRYTFTLPGRDIEEEIIIDQVTYQAYMNSDVKLPEELVEHFDCKKDYLVDSVGYGLKFE